MFLQLILYCMHKVGGHLMHILHVCVYMDGHKVGILYLALLFVIGSTYCLVSLPYIPCLSYFQWECWKRAAERDTASKLDKRKNQ